MSMHDCPCCNCEDEIEEVESSEGRITLDEDFWTDMAEGFVLPPAPEPRKLSIEEMREAVNSVWERLPTYNKLNLLAIMQYALDHLKVQQHEYKTWYADLQEFILKSGEFTVMRGKMGGIMRPGTAVANSDKPANASNP